MHRDVELLFGMSPCLKGVQQLELGSCRNPLGEAQETPMGPQRAGNHSMGTPQGWHQLTGHGVTLLALPGQIQAHLAVIKHLVEPQPQLCRAPCSLQAVSRDLTAHPPVPMDYFPFPGRWKNTGAIRSPPKCHAI